MARSLGLSAPLDGRRRCRRGHPASARRAWPPARRPGGWRTAAWSGSRPGAPSARRWPRRSPAARGQRSPPPAPRTRRGASCRARSRPTPPRPARSRSSSSASHGWSWVLWVQRCRIASGFVAMRPSFSRDADATTSRVTGGLPGVVDVERRHAAQLAAIRASSKGRARCMVARLSQITRSPRATHGGKRTAAGSRAR